MDRLSGKSNPNNTVTVGRCASRILLGVHADFPVNQIRSYANKEMTFSVNNYQSFEDNVHLVYVSQDCNSS